MVMDNKKMITNPPSDKDYAKYTAPPYNPFKDVPTSNYSVIGENGVNGGLG